MKTKIRQWNLLRAERVSLWTRLIELASNPDGLLLTVRVGALNWAARRKYEAKGRGEHLGMYPVAVA